MQMILDGKSVSATDGRTIEVRNPANGALVDTVPEAGAKDVERAIEVAVRGRSIMEQLPAHRRS